MTKDLADELERLAKGLAPYAYKPTGTIRIDMNDVRLVLWLIEREMEPCGECDAVSSAIGSVRWMDPPDGGSVTLSEQVSRMKDDLLAAEANALSALRGEEWQGIETVVVEARDAVAFLDRVRAASSDEQIAVGQDHWNRAEAALRAVAALPTKGTDHE